jgi:inhibitor of KinA sporulation pathway (predicted exonuclease)
VFDLEFTAWECSMAGHWLKPGEFKEVVQIGAVKLDADFQILDECEILVRPRINATLSPYLENLTGIGNALVTMTGVDFEPAYRRFVAFAGDTPIAVFGHDEWVLEENIRLYGLKDLPPLPPFQDLRLWFAEHGLDPRGIYSSDIAAKAGAVFTGRDHNALDDARGLAAGMRSLAGKRHAA